jgi:uncharacterized protein YidB (DUF937 family)
MVRLRSEIKRGFLRSLWRAASVTDGVSLNDVLDGFQNAGFGWVKSGRIVISTAGGGYSSSFNATQAISELSQEEVFAFSEELYTIRDSAVAALTAAGTVPAAQTDDLIVAAMLLDDRMAGAREEMNDYTSLRFGYGTNLSA